MHPHLLAYFVFFSGVTLILGSLALIVYHVARLARHLGDAGQTARRLVLTIPSLCLASISLFGYIYQQTVHTAVEIPLTPTAAGELNQDVWLTLPPEIYWSALIVPVDRGPDWIYKKEKVPFYLEYCVKINGQVADFESGLKDVDLGYWHPELRIGTEIVVRGHSNLVNIKLRIKPAEEGQAFPPMRFVIQPANELKIKSQGGHSIAGYHDSECQEEEGKPEGETNVPSDTGQIRANQGQTTK